jgi:hypothetical protein
MNVLLFIIVLVLVINAIFWSMYSHNDHCVLASMLGLQKCPAHWMHILFGIICYIAAVLIVQWKYIVQE